ncbi:hypothetical protein [Caldilinea sp.]|uniref:hypothetical protein n=1 Tax=Caldilinea sp. TaxID=2293560 RepID=UPI00263305F4|nr:hypothetical protein [uncultured Sphingorhabdus sp.]HQY94602.1 hypothetical protein [Caldilinea sp.]
MSAPTPPEGSAEPSGNSEVRAILARMRSLETELDAAFERARAELRLRIERDRVVFEEHILKRHRELKIRLLDYVRGARLMVVVTAPFIYAVIVPIVILDLFVTLYQATCFPVYGISKVRRRDYIVFDRQNLAYLNALEKLNCAYCSYANGLFAYVREIAARTEQYWCPIKHARRLIAPHAHYADFVAYGNAEEYHRQLEVLRSKLAAMENASDGDPNLRT